MFRGPTNIHRIFPHSVWEENIRAFKLDFGQGTLPAFMSKDWPTTFLSQRLQDCIGPGLADPARYYSRPTRDTPRL
jgi:hypothetical protein